MGWFRGVPVLFMRIFPSISSRDTGGAFETLLRKEQLANALRLNILRLTGVSAFLALEWLPRQTADTPDFALLAGYAVFAAVLLGLTFCSERIALTSRLAIPFLDMPLVFGIQHLNMQLSEVPRAVGNFSLAVFLVFILLAALSLEFWQILLAAAMAAGLQFLLHRQAGETAYGMLGGLVLIGSVATLCDFARRKRRQMVWALLREQLRRERLGRYFSPSVATAIERMGEEMSDGRQCDVTVLFSDLRDFTTLAERLETPEIVALLNDYFERMVDVVFEHGGTLDKYIGDGLMVYFGAPVAQEDHAKRAVCCAVAMQKKLTAYNATLAQPAAPLRMGIGIHSGTAVVGSIGASHRREYTAIGDTVNLAARIEQLCKTHQESILLSGETQRLAAGEMAFREVTECQVKGRVAPVRVFAPASVDACDAVSS